MSSLKIFDFFKMNDLTYATKKNRNGGSWTRNKLLCSELRYQGGGGLKYPKKPGSNRVKVAQEKLL